MKCTRQKWLLNNESMFLICDEQCLRYFECNKGDVLCLNITPSIFVMALQWNSTYNCSTSWR